MSSSIKGMIAAYCMILDEIRSGQGLGDEAALAVFQEVAKDLRMWQILARKKALENEPATGAQIDYLRRLGVEPRPGLTRKEASAVIDQASERPRVDIEKI